jgi:Ca2+-binding EF-hand superfamily protein
MNARLGLKLVFSIFDKNRNGLVDEDDLLQLISLSRTMPTLEIDIAPLSKAMLTLKEKRSLQRSKIGRLDSKG